MTEQLMGSVDFDALEKERRHRELQASWMANHPVAEVVGVQRDKYGAEAPERSNWQDQALCLNTNQETFFPENSARRAAKKLCIKCDVRTECLEEALARDEKNGIWGGLTERERNKLKNKGL